MYDIVHISSEESSPAAVAIQLLGGIPFKWKDVHERTGLENSVCTHAILSACIRISDEYDRNKATRAILDNFFQVGGAVLPGEVNAMPPSVYIESISADENGYLWPSITTYVVKDGATYALGVYFYVSQLIRDDGFMLPFRKCEFESEDGTKMYTTEGELGDWLQEECDAYKACRRTNSQMEELEEAMHLLVFVNSEPCMEDSIRFSTLDSLRNCRFKQSHVLFINMNEYCNILHICMDVWVLGVQYSSSWCKGILYLSEFAIHVQLRKHVHVVVK